MDIENLSFVATYFGARYLLRIEKQYYYIEAHEKQLRAKFNISLGRDIWTFYVNKIQVPFLRKNIIEYENKGKRKIRWKLIL